MHSRIKDFHLNGEMADANIVRDKEVLVTSVEDEMRDKGYVPILDLEPQFSLSFKPETKSYDFKLTVYGTFVGKDNSWLKAGMMNGKLLPVYTRPNKLNQSWNTPGLK